MKMITKRVQIKDIMLFIEFNEFSDTLFQKKILRHKMRGIKSKKHNVGTYETNKTSLSCFDDKQ